MTEKMAQLWVKHMQQYESTPPPKTTMQLWNEFLAAWRMLFGGARRERQQIHAARLLDLDRFWWTRNMSNTDAARFIDGRHGGLLSGAIMGKCKEWADLQRMQGSLDRFNEWWNGTRPKATPFDSITTRKDAWQQ